MRSLAGHSDGLRDGVLVIAFSPDGQRVVSVSRDMVIKIWDAASGTMVSSFVRERCGWRGVVEVF